MGVVANPEYLVKGRGQDLAKILQEEIDKCESCRKRLEGATRVDKVYSIIDYSYRSRKCAGDGFMLIGDAYGFLDPIYSSGVLLAFKMADLAANAIHDAFKLWLSAEAGTVSEQARQRRVDAQLVMLFIRTGSAFHSSSKVIRNNAPISSIC